MMRLRDTINFYIQIAESRRDWVDSRGGGEIQQIIAQMSRRRVTPMLFSSVVNPDDFQPDPTVENVQILILT
jgi:hypothetical protein